MTQLEAMAITFTLETLVAVCFAWGWKVKRSDYLPLLTAVIAASLLTHPIAWGINDALKPWFTYWQRIGVIELVVILAETVVLRLTVLPWRRAALLSAVMNTVSWGLGLVLYYLLWQ